MSKIESLDFEAFHQSELLARLAAGNGALAAAAAPHNASLAFRVEGRGAYTYRRADDNIEVARGEERADVVIELDHEDWKGVVNETKTAPGLLYGGRVKCRRGNAIKFVAWEPGLRAMYNGRPVWNPDAPLYDRHGDVLDPEQTFRLDDEREDMAHFMRTVGYLFVRDVFEPDEIAGFLEEAEALQQEARKGDQLSWWGTNTDGEEVLTRVTRAAAKPRLSGIPTDPRLTGLVELSHHDLQVRSRSTAEEGVSLIFKRPGMSEGGLSDLPWHRDCGMGGHSEVCPILIASVYLTESNPDSGDLRVLPGSWQGSVPYIDANHPAAPKGALFSARPGDLSLHYGDTMHSAPPPEDPNRASYRISAVTGYARPDMKVPRQKGGYNSVLHGREDGQIEHLSRVASRISDEDGED
jgi:ectoine hydroxylase-related dioxygenase (phytanoyl-CoA dioxygenase family)